MRFSVRLRSTLAPAASRQDPPSTATIAFIGLVAGGAGLYFMLVGLGVVPAPGKQHAPSWLVFAAGLVFFLGALGVILPRIAGVKTNGRDLPPGAPRWLQVAQYLLILTIFACFGAIGSWIAFGPGPRVFSGTVPVGPVFGRIVFGIGAVIVWLGFIAIAVSGWRRLFGRQSV
jgi:hypothetical protein